MSAVSLEDNFVDEFSSGRPVMLNTLALRSAARAYQSFAGRVAHVLQAEGVPMLGLTEEAMLDELAVLWTQHEQLPVLFALNRVHQAPQSRLHLSLNALGRLLHRLKQNGWVALESSDKDGRTKLVRPTAQTHRYFSVMGQCMAQAIHRENSRLR